MVYNTSFAELACEKLTWRDWVKSPCLLNYSIQNLNMEVSLSWLLSRKLALLGKVFAFWAALYVVLVVRKMVNLSFYTV